MKILSVLVLLSLSTPLIASPLQSQPRLVRGPELKAKKGTKTIIRKGPRSVSEDILEEKLTSVINEVSVYVNDRIILCILQNTQKSVIPLGLMFQRESFSNRS